MLHRFAIDLDQTSHFSHGQIAKLEPTRVFGIESNTIILNDVVAVEHLSDDTKRRLHD